MQSLNLLITNYCNQNCPFCFARKEMNNSFLQKEMSITKLKRIFKEINKDKIKRPTIKLLGGEPTLYKHLPELLELSKKYHNKVQIFTNGIMKKETVALLLKYPHIIGYTFNVMTPGFLFNHSLKTQVVKNLNVLRNKSKITLSFTISPQENITALLNKIPETVLKVSADIRLGFSNPIAGQGNSYVFSEFPKVGGRVVKIIKTLTRNGYRGSFFLNCGFTRCMFSDKEFAYIKTYIKKTDWSCFGKDSDGDVSVDMKAFHCFPLADVKRIDLRRDNVRHIESKLIRERIRLWNAFKLTQCISCPFYGFGKNKCPGPCIAFRINRVDAKT